MKWFYRIFNLILLALALTVLSPVVMAVCLSRIGPMRFFAGFYEKGFIVLLCIVFALFLLELFMFLRLWVDRWTFVISAVLIPINIYFGYICLFTHTPDFFTSRDWIWATKRFFLHMPLSNFWILIQGISFLAVIIIKHRKALRGHKVNLLISAARIALLWLYVLQLVLIEHACFENGTAWILLLVSAGWFAISLGAESLFDFLSRFFETPKVVRNSASK